MIKFRTKLLSVILAVVMFITFIPDSIYAEAADAINSALSENGSSETIITSDEDIPADVYALGEDVSKRTENAKYIRMSDGSYYVAVYDNAVHYQDEDGVWQDIDNTLSDSSAADSDDVTGVATNKGKHTVKFANNSNSSKLVAIKQGNYKISFNLVGANKSKAATVTNPVEHAEDATELEKITVLNKIVSSVRYADILDGVDLEYVVNGNNVKENIIVKSKSDEYVYQFDMKLNKLTAEMQADGRIALKDDKSGETVYVIDMPYMFDAKGEYSNAVTYTLEQIKNKEYRITVTADAEWMNDEERAFPVTIDPPIKDEQTYIFDTYVSSQSPASDYSESNPISVQNGTYTNYVYWATSLPEIPENCVIVKAELSMYNNSFTASTSTAYIGAHEVTGTWFDESSTDASINITWNSKPSWASRVIDYAKISSSTVNMPVYWNITSLAKKWHAGVSDNNGIVFIPLDAVANAASFTASFNSVNSTGVRPTLTVNYRNTIGIEDYYTYHNQSIGRAGTGYISDYTSALCLVHTDIASDSEATPFVISHVYNDGYYSGNFQTDLFEEMNHGYGWKLNIQESVVSAPIGITTHYVYTDGDGTKHSFYELAANTTNEYIDEDGLGLTLIPDGTKITLKDTQDNRKIFQNGRLVEIIYSDGNRIELNYGTNNASVLTSVIRHNKKSSGETSETIATFDYDETGMLDSITDSRGRTTSFTYTNGNLTKITFPDNCYASYTYDSNGMTSAMDSESVYKITYTRSNTTVSGNTVKTLTIKEYASNSAGNSLYVKNFPGEMATYTPRYRSSSGVDTDKPVSTTYTFDNMGRSVTVYSHGADGTVYGASSSGYTDGSNAKKANRIEYNSVIGKVPYNLLKNGSFEESGSWTLSGASIASGNAHSGQKSLRLTSGSNATQSYTFSSGKYTLSAYVNLKDVTFNSGASSKGIYVRIGNSSGEYFELQTGDTWHRISVTATVSGSANVGVYLVGATGTAYVDDIMLEKNEAASTYNFAPIMSKWDCISGTSVSQTTQKLTLSQPAGYEEDLSDSVAETIVPVYRDGGTTFLLSAWAELALTPSVEGRSIELQAEILYSNYTTETVNIPFNTDVYGLPQFVQGVIVPSYSYTVNNVTITLYCEDHVGEASLYNVALVEEDVQTYTYDNNGNLTATSQMNTTPIVNTYNSGNDIISSAQGSTKYTYTYGNTAYPHRVTAVKQDGITISFTYNSAGLITGNKITVVNTSGYMSSSNTYTSDMNRVSTTEDINGVNTTYGYTNGLLTSVTNDNDVTTRYTYNSKNDRQTSAYITGLAKVNYTYAKGALSKIVRQAQSDGADSMTYSFEYDAYGNTTKVKVGTYTLATYTYEPYNGKLIKTTYGNGFYVENKYDAFDRLIEIKTGSSPTATSVTRYKYAYNGNGDLSRIEDIDNGITEWYNYDSLDRLTSTYRKHSSGASLCTYYSYDEKGRAYKSDCSIAGVTGGTIAHTYEYSYNEADGSVSSLDVSTDGGNTYETVYYEYDKLKRLSSKLYLLNSTDIEYVYAYQTLSANRTSNLISGYEAYADSEKVLAYSYTYDDLGNIKTISQNGELFREYVYDAQGQLETEIFYDDDFAIDYVYDKYGNIVGIKEYSADKETLYAELNLYTYGDSQWRDRLTAYDGTPITYDNIGNPLSYYNGNEYTFTWQNGRELATAQKNSVTTSYKYGADGLRVQKTVGSVVYNYYYSDGVLVRQTWGSNYIDFLYDESGLPYSFVYGILKDGAYVTQQYYYVKNLQGDVIAITDASCAIVVEYNYDAWGNILSITDTSNNSIGTINPIRYRSYYYDTDTGFYYLQTRYYDPAIRRFINADAGLLNSTLGINLYIYCFNNPAGLSDYCGTQPKWAEKISNSAKNTVQYKIFAYITEQGMFSQIFYIAGFFRTGNVYHARQDSWQQYMGYNDLYDAVFNLVTDMLTDQFPFTYNGIEYIFWVWKGDYLNLGAGAELGLYYGGGPHWLSATNSAMPMSMSLYLKGLLEPLIATYPAEQPQWWITCFVPEYQNVKASDLTAVFTVTFPNLEMYEAFYNTYHDVNRGWTFYPLYMQAVLTF